MNFRRAALLIILLLPAVFTAEKNYILFSFDYDVFTEIKDGIVGSLPGNKITIFDISKEKPLIEDNNGNHCFVLGDSAYRYALENTQNIDIIAFMVYEPPVLPEDDLERVTLVEPEIDLAGKVKIIEEHILDLKGIIIPCTAAWYKKHKKEADHAVSEAKLPVRLEIVEGDPVEFFKSLAVPPGYMLLSVYDKDLYSFNNVYNIIRLTSERRIPFAGLSKGFVKRGAFLSVLPDYFNMGLKSVTSPDTATREIMKEYRVFVNIKMLRRYSLRVDPKKPEIRLIQ